MLQRRLKARWCYHTSCHSEMQNQFMQRRPCFFGTKNWLNQYCQVSSRSPVMMFYDVQSSLRGFQRNGSNASLISKDYSKWSDLWVNFFRTSKGAGCCVNPFHISLWASMAARMIASSHTIVAIPHTTDTNFLPPLQMLQQVDISVTTLSLVHVCMFGLLLVWGTCENGSCFRSLCVWL